MTVARVLAIALPLAALWGCSGGGGSSSTTQVGIWEKFRHDISNSGESAGLVEPTPDTTPVVRWRTQVDQGSPAAPISSSPAIGEDATVYIGTEGSTFAAINPVDGTVKWSLKQCDFVPHGGPNACIGAQPLGQLVSSAAVYLFNAITNIFIGSSNGTLFIIQDDGTTRTCPLCFQPTSRDFGPDATILASRFISSPTFTTSLDTGSVTAIFIGASIDLQRGGSTRTAGKLYAVNTDGSLRWQFPRPGDPDIGPITSSPSLGLDSTLYFTAADHTLPPLPNPARSAPPADHLYALTANGLLRWKFPLPAVGDATAPFAASPLTASLVYSATAGDGTTSGAITAINPDGSFRWHAASPDGSGFIASLAIGIPVLLTPTSTPSPNATPTPPPAGATATPTPTPTPFELTQAIFGITKSGTLVTIDVASGSMNDLLGPQPSISGPVISSPALSADSFLVVGAADGKLHIINTATGEEPSGWPLQLAPAGVPIRSSPAIATDGTVYVGADDGVLYAVKTR